MDSLTQQFNASADWSLYIAPLLTLLILDDIARRETRSRRQLTRLDHAFNARAQQKSRVRYHRQIADMHPSRRMARPRL